MSEKQPEIGDSSQPTKQERREKRLRKKREKMPQHGRSLVRVYRDAILKRLKSLK